MKTVRLAGFLCAAVSTCALALDSTVQWHTSHSYSVSTSPTYRFPEAADTCAYPKDMEQPADFMKTAEFAGFCTSPHFLDNNADSLNRYKKQVHQLITYWGCTNTLENARVIEFVNAAVARRIFMPASPSHLASLKRALVFFCLDTIHRAKEKKKSHPLTVIRDWDWNPRSLMLLDVCHVLGGGNDRELAAMRALVEDAKLLKFVENNLRMSLDSLIGAMDGGSSAPTPAAASESGSNCCIM